jgi:hypothetical protein
MLACIISGLFSLIDDDARQVKWIPRCLRGRPFLIGFLRLHIPASTVAACKAALMVHDAEQAQKHSSKVCQ